MSNVDIEQLKREADAIGAKYHHRAGAEKIQAAIEARQAEIALQAAEQGDEPEPAPQPAEEAKAQVYDMNSVPRPMTEEQFKEIQFAEKKQECNRLIRIRVQCMNPNKKNWTGEIISVGSAKLGTFKKFVPFNSEEPYHVPAIIYEEMKSRKCRIGTSTKGPNGQVVHRNKLIPEFSIEVLPPLTRDELRALAQRQAMAAGSAPTEEDQMRF